MQKNAPAVAASYQRSDNDTEFLHQTLPIYGADARAWGPGHGLEDLA